MKTVQFSNIISTAILSFATIASAVSLSGRVVNQDASATGKAGVTVTLVGRSLSTTTNAQGAWSLNGAVGVPPSIGFARPVSGHLSVDQGSLRLTFQGRDLEGRRSGSSKTSFGKPWVKAERAQAGVEFLAYSINGKVFLQDTVWNLTQSGITRVFDTTVNPGITYGYIKDDRDGQIYRTVVIGSQTWMAQNLNYKTIDSSWWYRGPDFLRPIPNVTPDYDTIANVITGYEVYDEGLVNGAVYGRIYEWTTAVQYDLSYDRRGICPVGWHIPNDSEWQVLTRAVEADPKVGVGKGGIALRSKHGWSYLDSTKQGTDQFGFRGLCAGYSGVIRDRNTGLPKTRLYDGKGDYHAIWWSYTKTGRFFDLSSLMDSVSTYGVYQVTNAFPVRCLAD